MANPKQRAERGPKPTRELSSLLVPEDSGDQSPINFRIEKYVEYRLLGFKPRQAAMQAGYKSHRDYMKFEQDPYVIERLQAMVQQTNRETLYTRDKVMEVIEEGIDMARIQADPMAIIRGAQEFNKMQGYYAPETKVIQLDVEHNVRIQQIQGMSEEDLLKAMDKELPYIDASFEELPEEI